MKRLTFTNVTFVIFVLCIILVPYCVLFAKDKSALTGVSVSAICDDSKLPNTDVRVFLLKPNEYKKYKRTKELTPIGNAPLLLKKLSPGEYYIGVGITYNEKVPVEQFSFIPPRYGPNPFKYYVDDMYDNWGHL